MIVKQERFQLLTREEIIERLQQHLTEKFDHWVREGARKQAEEAFAKRHTSLKKRIQKTKPK